MMVTYGFFSGLDTTAKYLTAHGIPPIQAVFTRYLVNFLLVLLVFLPRHGTQIFLSRSPGLQSLRAMALLSSTVFNFIALVYLPITVTTAIFFSAPMLVCLLSIKVLDEVVGVRRLAAVFVGFLAVAVTTQLWNANFNWAILLSLCSVSSYSTYIILTRKLAGTDSNATSQVYASGMATVLIAPTALVLWETPSSLLEWGLLGVMGLFGAIGHSLLTIAHRYAQASTLAPIVYIQIIYVTFLSWLIFNATPDFWTIVGTSIIVASGFYIWWRERRVVGG